MNNFLKKILLLFFILINGCATIPEVGWNYLPSRQQYSGKTVPLKIAVPTLKDNRKNENDSQAKGVLTIIPLVPYITTTYNKLEGQYLRGGAGIKFSFDLPKDIANSVALELSKSRLFEKAEFVYEGENLDNYDLVLQGELKNSILEYTQTLYGLSIAGMYISMLGLPMGKIEWILDIDFTLIDIKNNKIIWEYNLRKKDKKIYGIYYNKINFQKIPFPVLLQTGMSEALTSLASTIKSKDDSYWLAFSRSAREDKEPPSIIISAPKKNENLTDENVELLGMVDDNKEIEEVEIFVNGKKIDSMKGVHSNFIKIEKFFKIEKGANIVNINAKDSAGNISKEKILLSFIDTRKDKVDSTQDTGNDAVKDVLKSSKGQQWAVVVGISEYRNAGRYLPNLRYADRDAEEFYNFLLSPQGGGFSQDHVWFLKNEDATSSNLRKALFEFLKKAIKEDLVVIYFAGHGSPEPNNKENLYFLTYDTDPVSIPSTAFPMWDIETALRRHIKAQRIVIIADACHSAGVSLDIAMRDLPIENNQMNRYLTELSKAGKGIAVFTASEAGEQSQESQQWGGGHGVFTYFLLEGLKGKADMDSNGIVTLGEVMDYTDENVRRSTSSAQHPDTAGNFDRNLPMAVVK